MVNLNNLSTVCRTTEVDAVSDRLVAEFNKNDWSTDPHLTNIFNDLKTSSDKITSAINKIKAESNLEKKDEIRDGKVKSINYFVMGLVHHPDDTISDAAQKINDILENYGVKITKESYSIESSLIESLLLDLSKEELQPSIEALSGLSQLIASLRTAQNNFEEAKLEYEEEKAKEGTEETASDIKKEILLIVNAKLLIYLRAMVQVDENKYGTFANTIAQIIDDMNITVKKRRKNTPSVEDNN